MGPEKQRFSPEEIFAAFLYISKNEPVDSNLNSQVQFMIVCGYMHKSDISCPAVSGLICILRHCSMLQDMQNWTQPCPRKAEFPLEFPCMQTKCVCCSAPSGVLHTQCPASTAVQCTGGSGPWPHHLHIPLGSLASLETHGEKNLCIPQETSKCTQLLHKDTGGHFVLQHAETSGGLARCPGFWPGQVIGSIHSWIL